jgi:hypothetical protein
MQFDALLKQSDVLDIISVDETSYALTARHMTVPGCVVVPASQLATHLKEFLAKGYSHRHRKPYRQLAGFAPWVLYTYSLETLPPPRKQVFSHALMGTKTRTGLLAQWQGEKLGRGAFLTPQLQEPAVLAFFARWGVEYTREVLYRG